MLEDLHWADPGTLELLEYLVDKLDACSVAVVSTIRSGEASPAEQLARSLQARRQATVVELNRLSARDVAQMVTASLGGDAVPADLVSVRALALHTPSPRFEREATLRAAARRDETPSLVKMWLR